MWSFVSAAFTEHVVRVRSGRSSISTSFLFTSE